MKNIIKEVKFEILTTEIHLNYGFSHDNTPDFHIEFCDAYKNQDDKWCFIWTQYNDITEASRLRAAQWIKKQLDHDFFIFGDGGVTVSAVLHREGDN